MEELRALTGPRPSDAVLRHFLRRANGNARVAMNRYLDSGAPSTLHDNGEAALKAILEQSAREHAQRTKAQSSSDFDVVDLTDTVEDVGPSKRVATVAAPGVPSPPKRSKHAVHVEPSRPNEVKRYVSIASRDYKAPPNYAARREPSPTPSTDCDDTYVDILAEDEEGESDDENVCAPSVHQRPTSERGSFTAFNDKQPPYQRPNWSTKLLCKKNLQGSSTTRDRDVLRAGEYVRFERTVSKKSKKKQTQVSSYLRFVAVNDRNVSTLPVGRLSKQDSDQLQYLLDLDLIELRCRCLYCPERLTIFADILLELEIYISCEIFNPKRWVSIAVKSSSRFGRTSTQPESSVHAFCNLLAKMNINPLASSHDSNREELSEEAIQELRSQSPDQSSSSAPQERSIDQDIEADIATAAMQPPVAGSSQDRNQLVSSFQLNSLYASAQAQYANLNFMNQPHKLKCELRRYQQQALQWMTDRENQANSDIVSLREKRHPLWDEYAFPDGTRFYVNHFNTMISLMFPIACPTAKGGILADEMGMGKTIETLALLLQNHHKTVPRPPPVDDSEYRPNGGTLVVAPMSLIAQWCDEIHRFSDLKAVMYYGEHRRLTSQELRHADVVVTSYGVLSACFRKGANSPLHCIKWFRLVLDEAHVIRNRSTEQAKACFALQGERRWCLTGTPIQNHINDVFALLHFLREEPWANHRWWRTVISEPFLRQDHRALIRLQAVMHPLLLRRTKTMKDKNGNPILEIPPRTEECLELEFTQKEREFYEALYTRSKTSFDGFLSKGIALTQYCQILTLVLRLRQACDHPFLLFNPSGGDEDYKEDLERLAGRFRRSASSSSSDGGISNARLQAIMDTVQDNNKECPICLDVPDVPMISECGHLYCNECCETILSTNAECSICRQPMSRERVFRVPGRDGLLDVDLQEKWQHSSKTRALMRELEMERKADPTTKSVIFSQWSKMLDLVEVPLNQAGISFVRLDGSCSQKQRASVLKKFEKDDSVKVMLISLKAGGVGLNLVSASRVYFLDCWWNPAVEDQAIQRVHRIGQKRPVLVKRFIVKNTIERRIIDLQKQKQQLAAQVGMTSEQLKKVRLQDLQTLFRID